MEKEIFKLSNNCIDRTGFDETNDCVVIATAITFDVNYATAHDWVEKTFNRKPRNGTFNTGYKMLKLESNCNDYDAKFLNKKIKKAPLINKKYTHKTVNYTVQTFAKDFTVGRYFLLVKGHALSLIDGVIHDHIQFKEKGGRRPIRYAFKIE